MRSRLQFTCGQRFLFLVCLQRFTKKKKNPTPVRAKTKDRSYRILSHLVCTLKAANKSLRLNQTQTNDSSLVRRLGFFFTLVVQKSRRKLIRRQHLFRKTVRALNSAIASINYVYAHTLFDNNFYS